MIRSLLPKVASPASLITGSLDALKLLISCSDARPIGFYSFQEIVLYQSRLSVAEGGTATFRVKLFHRPSKGVEVIVSVDWFSGDHTISVSGGSTLAFNNGNWDTWQTTTVSAGNDCDTHDGTATLRCSSPRFQAVREVFVTEEDNDPLPCLRLVIRWPRRRGLCDGDEP
jgi:hypothetical protein